MRLIKAMVNTVRSRCEKKDYVWGNLFETGTSMLAAIAGHDKVAFRLLTISEARHIEKEEQAWADKLKAAGADYDEWPQSTEGFAKLDEFFGPVE